jgi:hypothetical protein
MAGFKITGGKGIHIRFDGGYTVSIQFGPGNYCQNYNLSWLDKDAFSGSPDAECAVWGPDGKMIQMPDWDDNVKGYMSPSQVLDLLNWAALQ